MTKKEAPDRRVKGDWSRAPDDMAYTANFAMTIIYEEKMKQREQTVEGVRPREGPRASIEEVRYACARIVFRLQHNYEERMKIEGDFVRNVMILRYHLLVYCCLFSMCLFCLIPIFNERIG